MATKYENPLLVVNNVFCCTDFEHIYDAEICTFSGGTEESERMSVFTPKCLTPISTLKTNVIKLYTNKRFRDVHPLNYKDDDQNSFRRAMSSFMLMAQCFALCPVQGITGLRDEHMR